MSRPSVFIKLRSPTATRSTVETDDEDLRIFLRSQIPPFKQSLGRILIFENLDLKFFENDRFKGCNLYLATPNGTIIREDTKYSLMEMPAADPQPAVTLPPVKSTIPEVPQVETRAPIASVFGAPKKAPNKSDKDDDFDALFGLTQVHKEKTEKVEETSPALSETSPALTETNSARTSGIVKLDSVEEKLRAWEDAKRNLDSLEAEKIGFETRYNTAKKLVEYARSAYEDALQRQMKIARERESARIEEKYVVKEPVADAIRRSAREIVDARTSGTTVSSYARNHLEETFAQGIRAMLNMEELSRASASRMSPHPGHISLRSIRSNPSPTMTIFNSSPEVIFERGVDFSGRDWMHMIATLANNIMHLKWLIELRRMHNLSITIDIPWIDNSSTIPWYPDGTVARNVINKNQIPLEYLHMAMAELHLVFKFNTTTYQTPGAYGVTGHRYGRIITMPWTPMYDTTEYFLGPGIVVCGLCRTLGHRRDSKHHHSPDAYYNF